MGDKESWAERIAKRWDRVRAEASGLGGVKWTFRHAPKQIGDSQVTMLYVACPSRRLRNQLHDRVMALGYAVKKIGLRTLEVN